MKYHVIDDRRGYSLVEILVVVGLIGIVSAIAIPQVGKMFGFYRLSGDARSISNSVAGAKMRAASEFSQARIYVDLSGGTSRMEVWDKINKTWSIQGPTTYLSSNVSFGKGSVGTAPPANSLIAASQAPACTNDPLDKSTPGKDTTFTGPAITGTSCIVFNSRGLPTDATGAPPNPDYALYITDGASVYGVTVAATGMIRSWQTVSTSTPSWLLN